MQEFYWGNACEKKRTGSLEAVGRLVRSQCNVKEIGQEEALLRKALRLQPSNKKAGAGLESPHPVTAWGHQWKGGLSFRKQQLGPSVDYAPVAGDRSGVLLWPQWAFGGNQVTGDVPNAIVSGMRQTWFNLTGDHEAWAGETVGS